MSMDTHLKIIEALANGIDPLTGEVLPNESPYNHPDTIRALFAVINHIKHPPKKKQKIKKPLSKNAQIILKMAYLKMRGYLGLKRKEMCSQLSLQQMSRKII
ncbi:hypothetical protein [uncultured Shewanella sp.]|uniref:hypothetical protein n=1 Tax=uncultured Shewanella sp. TaxID=173975 RepID=UPI00260344E5|nr:hypothetical protein [uncultured Shewanella sp.]